VPEERLGKDGKYQDESYPLELVHCSPSATRERRAAIVTRISIPSGGQPSLSYFDGHLSSIFRTSFARPIANQFEARETRVDLVQLCNLWQPDDT
jgi:hypothetical protein